MITVTLQQRQHCEGYGDENHSMLRVFADRSLSARLLVQMLPFFPRDSTGICTGVACFALQGREMSQALALFDLDGTLVRCQTQRCLLAQCRERGHVDALAHGRLLFWFGLYKLGIISDPQRPMAYAYRFTAGWPVEQLALEMAACVESRILPLLDTRLVERVEEERRQGRHLLLVSNSIAPMVTAVARHLRMDGAIGTRLETRFGSYTGKLEGAIAYGREKVRLVRDYAAYRGLSLRGSVAYADHISDLPLLETADRAVAVNPCRRLRPIALARGWEVLYS